MYEETKNQPEYLKTLHKLAELYAARCVILLSSSQPQVVNEGYSDDAVKCAEADAAEVFARVAKLDPKGLDHGLRAQEEHA